MTHINIHYLCSATLDWPLLHGGYQTARQELIGCLTVKIACIYSTKLATVGCRLAAHRKKTALRAKQIGTHHEAFERMQLLARIQRNERSLKHTRVMSCGTNYSMNADVFI
jgi:hypothetical protein